MQGQLSPAAGSSSGSVFFNDNVTTPVQMKATKGQIYWLYANNTSGGAAYLQIWFKPLSGVNFGTTAPDWVIRMSSLPMPPFPVPVGDGTGITIAGTSVAVPTTSVASLSVSAVYR